MAGAGRCAGGRCGRVPYCRARTARISCCLPYGVPNALALALTAGGTSEDAGTTPDSGTVGDPNNQAVGTWNLTGSPACNLSFSGAWQGERVSANEFGFRIVKSQQESFNCTIRATDTTKFTCSDVNVGGPIAPGSQCTANYSFTNVSGTFARDAVELIASIQVTSPTCGQVLNCGPNTHNASGTIAR